MKCIYALSLKPTSMSLLFGGEFAIYCFHRFLGVFLSMSSVHLSRFGFCRERVRTKRWWEVREWGKKCVQWEVCGIQLIDQSDRTLCPGTLSNSSKDNCSQDVCLWACVSLYLCEDILHILLWLKSNFGLLFHCAERVRRQFQNWKEERGTFLVFRGVKHLFRTEDGLPFSSKILYIWRLCVLKKYC